MQVRPPSKLLKLKVERLTVDSVNNSQSGRINAYKLLKIGIHCFSIAYECDLFVSNIALA
jgi:hypothetical protein